MILYPPAKINLGLHILGKRTDGYHNIESCMVSIPLYDILEVTKSESFEFIQTGIKIDGIPGGNLCEKAFVLLQDHYGLSPVRIHLRKQIPIGAGLGGGSADATFVLLALNQLFQLKLTSAELKNFAAVLGSDCPFFVEDQAQIATGRGELLQAINIDLSNYYLVLLNPGIHVGTKEAYAGVQPSAPLNSLVNILKAPVHQWKHELMNDFESSVFSQYPSILALKEQLYDSGAVYAAMSGSGSSVFGIFEREEIAMNFTSPHLIYNGKFINQP